MSFLNPVNEPVLRFKSTDTGAPQINYNARTAGDVKAVLKACLVTGYGATASAGWSIVNEVDHVAEFVSPSAAMSDYRIGVDDSSTSQTDWYYLYQNIKTNPFNNRVTKSISVIDKTHANNGWQLITTNRGLLFVELWQHSAVNKITARITYIGQLKSALLANDGVNMCFFNIGHKSTLTYPSHFYTEPALVHKNVQNLTNLKLAAATSPSSEKIDYAFGVSGADLVSEIYLHTTQGDTLVAKMPPVLSKIVNKATDTYQVKQFDLNSRPVLSVCAGHADFNVSKAESYSRTMLIPLDYWEY